MESSWLNPTELTPQISSQTPPNSSGIPKYHPDTPRHPSRQPQTTSEKTRHKQTHPDIVKHSKTPLTHSSHTPHVSLGYIKPPETPKITSLTPCHPRTHILLPLDISKAVPKIWGHHGVLGVVWEPCQVCVRSVWGVYWSVWRCLVLSVCVFLCLLLSWVVRRIVWGYLGDI